VKGGLTTESTEENSKVVPFPNCSCREDEPKTVLKARRGEVDKGMGNSEMELVTKSPSPGELGMLSVSG
jgi:hypothetical protein